VNVSESGFTTETPLGLSSTLRLRPEGSSGRRQRAQGKKKKRFHHKDTKAQKGEEIEIIHEKTRRTPITVNLFTPATNGSRPRLSPGIIPGGCSPVRKGWG